MSEQTRTPSVKSIRIKLKNVRKNLVPSIPAVSAEQLILYSALGHLSCSELKSRARKRKAELLSYVGPSACIEDTVALLREGLTLRQCVLLHRWDPSLDLPSAPASPNGYPSKRVASAVHSASQAVQHASPTEASAVHTASQAVQHASPTEASAVHTASQAVQHASPTETSAVHTVSQAVQHASPTETSAVHSASQAVQDTSPTETSAVHTASQAVQHASPTETSAVHSASAVLSAAAVQHASPTETSAGRSTSEPLGACHSKRQSPAQGETPNSEQTSMPAVDTTAFKEVSQPRAPHGNSSLNRPALGHSEHTTTTTMLGLAHEAVGHGGSKGQSPPEPSHLALSDQELSQQSLPDLSHQAGASPDSGPALKRRWPQQPRLQRQHDDSVVDAPPDERLALRRHHQHDDCLVDASPNGECALNRHCSQQQQQQQHDCLVDASSSPDKQPSDSTLFHVEEIGATEDEQARQGPTADIGGLTLAATATTAAARGSSAEHPQTSAQAGSGGVLPLSFLGSPHASSNALAQHPFLHSIEPSHLRMSVAAVLPAHELSQERVNAMIKTAMEIKRSGDQQRGAPSAPWRVGSLSKYVEASLMYMEACMYMLRLPKSSERSVRAATLFGQTVDLLMHAAKQAELKMRGVELGKETMRILCERLAAICGMREASLMAGRFHDPATKVKQLLQLHQKQQQQQQAAAPLGQRHVMHSSTAAELGQATQRMISSGQRVMRYSDLVRRSTIGFQAVIERPDVRSNLFAKLACVHLSAIFKNGGMGDGLQLIAHAREALAHIKAV